MHMLAMCSIPTNPDICLFACFAHDAAWQVPCTGRAVTPSSERVLTRARMQAQEDRASDKAAAEMEKLRVQLEEAERKAKSLEDMQRQAAAMQVRSAARVPTSWTVTPLPLSAAAHTRFAGCTAQTHLVAQQKPPADFALCHRRASISAATL